MEKLISPTPMIIFLFMLLSSTLILPETAHAFAKPFLLLWLRLKKYRASLILHSPKEKSTKFWEIDMTKLEP
jgi:hypothetical protein